MSKFGRRALHTEPPHWSNDVSYLLTRQDIVPSRALEMWNGMSPALWNRIREQRAASPFTRWGHRKVPPRLGVTDVRAWIDRNTGQPGRGPVASSPPRFPVFLSAEKAPYELNVREKVTSVTDDIKDWKKVAAILREAIPQIDKAFSQANVPISARKLKAFDIVQDTILQVSDHKAFLLSEAYGRFLIIIEDWYRDRYGDAVDDDEDGSFVSMLLVHGTPFAMRVPKVFKTSTDEPNMVWIGFPALVQAEEDPLSWIQSRGVVCGLSSEELDVVRKAALETANLVRSIGFDVRSLEHEENLSIVELAGSVRADLESSARNLCERTEAGLRSTAWDASQATEKALKLLIWRRGQTPPHNHKLSALADRAESLGGAAIDRVKLALVPSGHDATDIRYGGNMTLSKAVDAYGAALSIIRQVVFEAKPDTKYNVREARFKIQRPPWFDFDTSAFSATLRRFDNVKRTHPDRVKGTHPLVNGL